MTDKELTEEQVQTLYRRILHIHEAFCHRMYNDPGDATDISFLALGLNGEAGEVANKIKKIQRGDFDFGLEDEMVVDCINEELAGVAMYLWLIAHYCDIDLQQAMYNKQAINEERFDDVIGEYEKDFPDATTSEKADTKKRPDQA